MMNETEEVVQSVPLTITLHEQTEAPVVPDRWKEPIVGVLVGGFVGFAGRPDGITLGNYKWTTRGPERLLDVEYPFDFLPSDAKPIVGRMLREANARWFVLRSKFHAGLLENPTASQK